MKFWKLHGIGNDFIAIDGRLDEIHPSEYSKLAKKVCHRRFSVGADGLLIVKNSDKADVEMMYYNSDGSRGEMCGNGLRCFAKFIYDNNINKNKEISVETLDGIKNVELHIKEDEIEKVKVNMGKGSFETSKIPVNTKHKEFINETIKVLDKEFVVSSMLMGVPHTVVFLDKEDDIDIQKYGSAIENHKVFPNNTNVNFVKIIDTENIIVNTWERGCGYTLGCGTGMTASAVICNKLNKTGKSVNVISEGGNVKIDIEDSIYMTGNAVKICEGTLEV